MENIDNSILIYTYNKAVELELSEEFLDLLRNELYVRGIKLEIAKLNFK